MVEKPPEASAFIGQERAAREDAEALSEIALALVSHLDLQQIVQAATDAATRLTGAKFGAFFYKVNDASGESLLLYTLSGAPREAFDRFGIPRSTQLFAHTFSGLGPVRVADIATDERYGKNPPHHGMPSGHLPVRSYLAIPVVSRSGAILGGLFFGHPEPGIFTERAERLVLGVAAQASVAIDNARLYQEAREQQEKLRAQLSRLALLDQLTRAINRRQDLSSVFPIVTAMLEEKLPVEFCAIYLVDDSQSLFVPAGSGPGAVELLSRNGAAASRLAIQPNRLQAVLEGRPIQLTAPEHPTAPFCRELASAGLISLLVTPLILEQEVFGALIIARKSSVTFSAEDSEFVRQVAEHVSLAAHQRSLQDSLRAAYDDLRQTQQAMFQHERLGALGQMASGIAHDINNAISPASLYAETLLERETSLSRRGRECLEVIQRAIDDVAGTVNRLREFYRPETEGHALDDLDLAQLVQQVIEHTRARWSDMAQETGVVYAMKVDAPAGLPAIRGSHTEIRDALTNVVFNSLDAMPQGGEVVLRAFAEHGYVIAEIRDTGIGMPEEVRRRCIEPFFTTKGQRGTGLGLASVYGMLQRHRGELQIESQAGAGTTVRLKFPQGQAMNRIRPSQAARPPQPSVSLRILLIDDDPAILTSLTDILEADLHEVVAVSDGQQGIDTFTQAAGRGDPFQIVITDLGMPRVDGRKVAIAIHACAPHTPIVMLTGWGQRLIDSGELPEHVTRVLPKPPRIDQLRQVLASVCSPR